MCHRNEWQLSAGAVTVQEAWGDVWEAGLKSNHWSWWVQAASQVRNLVPKPGLCNLVKVFVGVQRDPWEMFAMCQKLQCPPRDEVSWFSCRAVASPPVGEQ